MRRRERQEPRAVLRLLASAAGDSAVRSLRQDTGRAAGGGGHELGSGHKFGLPLRDYKQM